MADNDWESIFHSMRILSLSYDLQYRILRTIRCDVTTTLYIIIQSKLWSIFNRSESRKQYYCISLCTITSCLQDRDRVQFSAKIYVSLRIFESCVAIGTYTAVLMRDCWFEVFSIIRNVVHVFIIHGPSTVHKRCISVKRFTIHCDIFTLTGYSFDCPRRNSPWRQVATKRNARDPQLLSMESPSTRRISIPWSKVF